MAAYDRSASSAILPYQLEPTSTVADSESDSTNSVSDDSSDSDSSAAMVAENVVDVRAGNTDWCKCHRCATEHLVRPDEYVCCLEKRVWQSHAVHDAEGKRFTVQIWGLDLPTSEWGLFLVLGVHIIVL